MKYISTLLIIFYFGILNAQIGIGTTNPQADLHIAGDVLIQGKLELNNLEVVDNNETGFKLITRTSNSSLVGEIKVLDVSALNVAPVNTIDYRFSNLSSDNLSDVDLQYDCTKYIVGIANFKYKGDAIKKVDLGTTTTIGRFVVRTFQSGGTWHLEIQNKDLDLDIGDSVEYIFTLIVYDKSYYRNLPTITSNLGGSNAGTASSIPVLY